jgi:hypothetical protein
MLQQVIKILFLKGYKFWLEMNYYLYDQEEKSCLLVGQGYPQGTIKEGRSKSENCYRL